MFQLKNIGVLINKVFGPILLVFLSFNIYNQISNQPELKQAITSVLSFSISKIFVLVIVFFLMLLSFVIEAVKWKILVNPFQKISLFTACKNIFTGQAFAFTSINDMGDFVGRVMHFKENKVKLGALSVLATYSQILIIIGFGLLAWMYNFNLLFVSLKIVKLIAIISFVGCFFVFLFFFICYYNLKMVMPLFHKIKWLQWLFKIFEKVYEVEKTVLTKLLLYSFLKYVVYTVQYLLVLQLFEVGDSYIDLASMVALLLFGLTIIPSIAFAELGIRGKLALVLFGLLSSNQLSILIATVVIWLINRVLPAIIGTFFASTIKLKN